MFECHQLDRKGLPSFDATLFKNPSSEFFPAYAWIWNAEISEESIYAQIDDFVKAGIRGIYILPLPKEFRPAQRTELSPEYMSEAFLDYYEKACRYAIEKGISLWMYDEAGFPSGGAFGLVRKQYSNASSFYLEARPIDSEEQVSPKCITVIPNAEGHLIEYRMAEFYQNENMVNLGDPHVVDAFIDVTYRPYARQLGSLIGDRVQLMFTDEPYLKRYAWMDGWEHAFIERYGYDLRPYFDVVTDYAQAVTEEQKKAKIDYANFCADIFKRTFFERCAEECHKIGTYFGGHLNVEHDPSYGPWLGYGNFLMPLRTMDIPGIDAIWRQIYPYKEGSPTPESQTFFPRLASSAANQNGGQLALSETFSVYGDAITADEMQYVVNFQFLRGINLFNFMSIPFGKKSGMTMNMRPTLCPEKPGFLNMSSFYERVARSSVAMQSGKRHCDTALYFPQNDLAVGGAIAQKAQDSYASLGEDMEKRLIDFDIIDDEAIRFAREEDGVLKIGAAEYRHIVMPDCAYVPKDVLEILSRYQGEGTPLGKASSDAIRMTSRVCENGRLYMVFNQSPEAVESEIMIEGNGSAYRLDPSLGTVVPASFPVNVQLHSGEAVFYFFSDCELACDASALRTLALGKVTPIQAKRFFIEKDGLAIRDVALSEISSKDFSGEVELLIDYRLPENGNADERFLLSLDYPKRSARIYDGERLLGTVSAYPQVLLVDGLAKEGTLRVILANTTANEIYAKKDTVMAEWDQSNFAAYHEKCCNFEADSLFSVL